MRYAFLLLLLLTFPALSPAGEGFAPSLTSAPSFLQSETPTASVVSVTSSSARLQIHLPPDTSVSAASLRVQTDAEPPVRLSCRLENPPADDSLATDFTLLVEGALQDNPTLILSYQLCAGTICYPPKEISIPLSEQHLPETKPTSTESLSPETALQLETYVPGLESCSYIRTFTGAADPDTFLDFLAGSKPGDAKSSQTFVDRAFAYGGLPLLFLALLIAGFLLNFTPCVLPLIPVNLALLGAGMSESTSRRIGFSRGAAFGLGITIVYGSLGLLSALTGQAFGRLHASILFQATVALVFLLLAAGMLDLLRIDFSALGRHLRPRHSEASKPNRNPRFLQALAAGAASALLSGACVAPVLVSALVLSADLVRRGQSAGVLLPFLLGAGMALPWPFLAGGLAALPKPGAWMERIKHLFAIVFILMAGFYAYQAYRLVWTDDPTEGLRQQDPNAAVLLGKITQRDILVFYTAEWCGACREMKKSTLRNPRVTKAMDEFVVLTLDCTKIDDPDVKRNLELGHAIGLPAFAVFRPPALADSDNSGENAITPPRP